MTTHVDPQKAASRSAPDASVSPSAAAVKPAEPTTTSKPAQTVADDGDPFQIQAVDFDKLSGNIAKIMENGGRALAAYIKGHESGTKRADTEGVTDMVKTLGQVAQYWLQDPMRTSSAQQAIASRYAELWASTLKHIQGEPTEPVAAPSPSDKRFKDPQWSKHPFFDFMKQFYLITSDWADKLVQEAELEPHLKHKATFYTKQVTGALSPSNFLVTNPEVLRETIKTSGDNLVRGTTMLAEDIERGKGDLVIRQSDESKFGLGVNLAMTPGKVVYQNDLIQLIQYAPTTPSVSKVPLIIVPPWINKFYILDLTAEKSFIKWCVDQGLTVFVVSWVNPDERHRKKSFADYMHEGPLAAIDAVNEITGRKKVHTIGYCVGGTLMAVTLAYMAAKKDNRILTNTFFTTQVDFTYAGDLLVFADEENIASVEESMKEDGYLDGKKMATAFNMLRANDLIWNPVVNNYMKGKTPMAFDLLYWNGDATRMPAANHSFYLRHCYLKNDLARGKMVVDGVKLNLGKVKTPIYNLAAREDHIAPARSVFVGSSLFGGPVDYVMAGSGHIAGVVNPPASKKYQYWTGGKPSGNFDNWVVNATEHPGSWWPHWRAWLRSHDGKEVEPRIPGEGPLKAIEDAPGSYVKIKA